MKKIEFLYFESSTEKSRHSKHETELLFHLNDNMLKDRIPSDLQDFLESTLEKCLDDLCLYYNDLLILLDIEIDKKYSFLKVSNQKKWLISKIYSKDIESKNSAIRLIAYLDFLLRISSDFKIIVRTDNKLFYELLISNGIKCKLIKYKNKPNLSFFKILLSHFLISRKFQRKVSLYDVMFLSLSSNWNQKTGDRHYGQLKNLKTEFSYIHFLTTTKHISNYSSENDIVLNSYLAISDFVKVIAISLKLYAQICIKPKLQFSFNSMKLSSWVNTLLKEMLINEFLSFSFYSRSIVNYFKYENRDDKILITYGELFSSNLLLYSQLRNLEKSPKIIAIQHAINFKRKLSNHEKNLDDDNLPDLYLIHGHHFSNYLSSYDLNLKWLILGCLKYEGIKFEKQSIAHLKKKILIAPSLNDFYSILKTLKELLPICYEKYEFYISAHPAFNSSTLSRELGILGFPIHIVKGISTLEFAKSCDIVLFSYSSIGLEALFFNKKIIRVYSRKLPKLFDDDNRIPTVYNGVQLEEELVSDKVIPAKELIEYYFGNCNGVINNRLDLILSKLKSNIETLNEFF